MRDVLVVLSMSALLLLNACGGSGGSSGGSSGGGSTCSAAAVPLTQQLRNPISAFAADNNGVILALPNVAVGGQASVASGQGVMIFGIGTQSNNALGTATVLTIDTNAKNTTYGGFNTTYNGKAYPGSTGPIGSFIDSGSNAIFFLDQPITGIPTCSSTSSFYCPASPNTTLSLTATNTGANGASIATPFNVTSLKVLSGANTAFSDVAGANSPGSPSSTAGDGYFDWGASFFFGKNVYTSFQGTTQPSGVTSSTYWAYGGPNSIPLTGVSNVAPLTVDAGPIASNPQFNVIYTTVTVCAPGSATNCQTIDHVMVDTGSSGLRIPVGVLNSTLAAALPNVNTTTPVAECVQFLDQSYFWGSVRLADVKLGGSNNNSAVASSIPIQVMGDSAFPTVPSSCSTVPTVTGGTAQGTAENTAAALGANGLIGVGTLQRDCDTLSGSNACTNASTAPSGMYYTCR